MEYGLIFHGTRTGEYYCKNMKYRINYTRKMVPIPRRASSFFVVVFIHVNRKVAEEGETKQQQQFT